jgi:hypothetical protein
MFDTHGLVGDVAQLLLVQNREPDNGAPHTPDAE